MKYFHAKGILVALSLLLSAAAHAAGEQAASTRLEPAIEVPELSADAKKLLAEVGKRISNIDTPGLQFVCTK